MIIILLEGETHLEERKSIPYQLKKNSPDDGTGTNHREGTRNLENEHASSDTDHQGPQEYRDKHDQTPLKGRDGDYRRWRIR
jgi:hypothetical protein